MDKKGFYWTMGIIAALLVILDLAGFCRKKQNCTGAKYGYERHPGVNKQQRSRSQRHES